MRQPADNRDRGFLLFLSLFAGLYVALIVGMLLADATYTTPGDLLNALESEEIRYAAKLSLTSSTITALLSVWFAIPIGYLLSRTNFPGKTLVDGILDIPIVLPPMVIGLSLLILFQSPLGEAIEAQVPVTYRVPSVILAQFAVACAFAVRTMRVTFDQLPERPEQVALTLGATRAQAFWRVTLPLLRSSLFAGWILVFTAALRELPATLLLKPLGGRSLATEIWKYAEDSHYDQMAPAALLLLCLSVPSVVLLLRQDLNLHSPNNPATIPR